MPYELNRKSPGIEADRSLTAARVPVAAKDHEWRGRPSLIRQDNSPEYISDALLPDIDARGILITHIQSVKPQQNNQIKRYNCSVR